MDQMRVNIAVIQIAVIDSVVRVRDVVFLKDGNVMEVRLQDSRKSRYFKTNVLLSFRQRLH